ncbi:putative bifunctional diguanylate cyclase/phosphodiesterase [Mongoliimonas terrestris]|uniref:putative bifunctional diguanylate cyclase/phosphodiesterase n=1 Tax=Mongoliimonas terrestris TaxID=1709001 RepID=UPI0009499BEA|nr:GGDEF domain-containing phosphodiesterase [Mongoliimonas terrestris]
MSHSYVMGQNALTTEAVGSASVGQTRRVAIPSLPAWLAHGHYGHLSTPDGDRDFLTEERLRLAVAASGLAIWELDLATYKPVWSQELKRLMEWPECLPVTDETFWTIVHPEDREEVVAAFEAMLEGCAPGYHLEYRFILPLTGRVVWIAEWARLVRSADSRPVRVVGAVKEITARIEVEERLRFAAEHDALTGLYNRAALKAKLRDACEKGRNLSLVLIDLDDFKQVNDTLGHEAGDTLLKMVASKLRDACPESTIARLGGDEFALLLDGGCDPDEAALRIMNCLAAPLHIGASRFAVRCSIGIASSADDAGSPEAILRAADLALYAAKGAGRNRAVAFEPEMLARVERRNAVVAGFHDAIALGQVGPYYQPKVDLRSGAVIGFETLARWRHPQRGILTPQAFRDAFGDATSMLNLGREICHRAAADMRSWLDAGLPIGRVAINVSPQGFTVPGIARVIVGHFAERGIGPEYLEVEITENVLVEGHACQAAEVLRQFREAGVRVALDDFGTGYASLIHLKRFPIDTIKIDRSFVAGLELDRGDATIVAGVIAMAHGVGLTVVAEGVETQRQAAMLRQAGCDHAQGFLFGQPVPAEAIGELFFRPNG